MQYEREISVVVSDIGQTLTPGGLEYYRKLRGQYDPRNPATMAIVYDAFQPFPCVQAGFGRLTGAYRFGGYYTVRPAELRDQATSWINRSSLPDSGNIHVCRDHEDKVHQVLRDILAPYPNTRAILVDDNADGLTRAATKIVTEDPRVIDQTQRLAIVEFSRRETTPDFRQGSVHFETGIHLFRLKSWNEQDVEGLIGALAKVGF